MAYDRHRAAADDGPVVAVLIAGGYYAGRLRELRDPQGALAPMALGAAAAAIATIGYGIASCSARRSRSAGCCSADRRRSSSTP